MRRILLVLLAAFVLLSASAPSVPADDGGAGDLARRFFTALFERRYEDAHALTTGRTAEETAFARYDAWAGKYFSPSDLKVLRVKPDGDGTVAVVTFKYKTPAGVDAVERAELRLAGAPGAHRVEGLKRRAGEADPAAAGGHHAPVTIPQNLPGAPGGNPFGALSGLLSGMGGNAGGGAPGGELGGLLNSGPFGQLMADPQVLALASDPRVRAIANDPRIVGAIFSGDFDAIMNDPRLQQLADDPAFKNVLEKYVPSGEGNVSPAMNDLLDLLGK